MTRLKLVSATMFAAVIATTAAAAGTGSYAGPTAANGRIAFNRYFGPSYDPHDDKSRGVIVTIAPSGAGERQVTRPSPDTSDVEPDWSPDGSRIVFARSGRRGPAIYTVRPDGSGLTRVSRPCSRSCDQDITPAFSPRGREIAFASSDGRLKTTIVVAGWDGGNRRVVVPPSSGAELVDPRFSPDGKQIAFELHNLTRAPRDGRAVFVVDADGRGLSRVTPWLLDAGDPDWSPDGRWILFGSNESLKKPSQLYVIHPDGSGLKPLTRDRRGTLGAPGSFSQDGKWIVFAATGVGGNADVYVMRADGTGIRQLTRTRRWDSAPDWGPVP